MEFVLLSTMNQSSFLPDEFAHPRPTVLRLLKELVQNQFGLAHKILGAGGCWPFFYHPFVQETLSFKLYRFHRH